MLQNQPSYHPLVQISSSEKEIAISLSFAENVTTSTYSCKFPS